MKSETKKTILFAALPTTIFLAAIASISAMKKEDAPEETLFVAAPIVLERETPAPAPAPSPRPAPEPEPAPMVKELLADDVETDPLLLFPPELRHLPYLGVESGTDDPNAPPLGYIERDRAAEAAMLKREQEEAAAAAADNS